MTPKGFLFLVSLEAPIIIPIRSKPWTPVIIADLVGARVKEPIQKEMISKSRFQYYHLDDAPFVNCLASELLYGWDRTLCGNVVITGRGNRLLSYTECSELMIKCRRIEAAWH